MFANKCPKYDKIYIFEKPLAMPFQICIKILNNSMYTLKKKKKMCKSLLACCMQIIFKKFLFPLAGQTAGPNGLKFLWTLMG